VFLELRALLIHPRHVEAQAGFLHGGHAELLGETDGRGRADFDAQPAEGAAVQGPVKFHRAQDLGPLGLDALDVEAARRADALAGLAGDAQRLPLLVAVEAEQAAEPRPRRLDLLWVLDRDLAAEIMAAA